MDEQRHSELMAFQGELAGAALKAAMGADRASGPEAAVAAGSAGARRAVRVYPLAWMVVAFLAGTVAGALLRPVTVRARVRAGRDAR